MKKKNRMIFQKVSHDLGIHKEDFVIVMVARFDPVKCHTLAFAALKEVIRLHPHVKLLLVGDGPIREDLERAVREDHLEQNVLFLRISEGCRQVLPNSGYHFIDIKTESFPLVLLESARECTPAITTDVGGVKKMIPDSTFGFIVAVDNVRMKLFQRLKRQLS